jgi:hypothetical protein
MNPLTVTGNIEPPVSTWVEKKRPKARERFYCSTQRRVVSMAYGTPVFVFPIGRVRVPLIRDFDTLAFVNMSPKQIEVVIGDNVISEDGVPIACRITILAAFREDPVFVKRIVLAPDAEACLLPALLTMSVQGTARSTTWHEIASSAETMAETIESAFYEKVEGASTCFTIDRIVLSETRPLEEVLAVAHEKAVRGKASETILMELAELQHERELIERKAEKDAAEDRLEIQGYNLRSELELARHKLQLEQEKKEAAVYGRDLVRHLWQIPGGCRFFLRTSSSVPLLPRGMTRTSTPVSAPVTVRSARVRKGTRKPINSIFGWNTISQWETMIGIV